MAKPLTLRNRSRCAWPRLKLVAKHHNVRRRLNPEAHLIARYPDYRHYDRVAYLDALALTS